MDIEKVKQRPHLLFADWLVWESDFAVANRKKQRRTFHQLHLDCQTEFAFVRLDYDAGNFILAFLLRFAPVYFMRLGSLLNRIQLAVEFRLFAQIVLLFLHRITAVAQGFHRQLIVFLIFNQRFFNFSFFFV